MIDTVAIRLENKEFILNNTREFKLKNDNGYYKRYFLYRNYKKFGYWPRLTLEKRPEENNALTVEFSAPKLLLGNNFDELSEKDFELLLDKLVQCLEDMGITVYKWNLRKARLSKIHFSKNIVLNDYSKCSMVINELEKADICNRVDIEKTRFRNKGEIGRIHTNAYEIAFYDKIRELIHYVSNGPKRAFEKDQECQFDLRRNIEEIRKSRPFEVLRMEARFNKTRDILALLKKLDLPKDLTFETLFKENTSKAVLTNYWEMIVHKLEAVGFEERDSFNMVTQLINMGFNPKQAYALESSINTINQYGMRRFRSTFGKKYERMFYDYKKVIKSLKLEKNTRFAEVIKFGKALKKFETVKLDKFKF